MLPTVAEQCVLGIIRNPFGEPIEEPTKCECDRCAMVLSPNCEADVLCPNCLKKLSS